MKELRKRGKFHVARLCYFTSPQLHLNHGFNLSKGCLVTDLIDISLWEGLFRSNLEKGGTREEEKASYPMGWKNKKKIQKTKNLWIIVIFKRYNN